jgi:hypothetical protein
MGAPTSAILAEIFLQHQEHKHIINLLQKHNIIDYYRYVDDILIIYNEDNTDIDHTLKDFNSIHPNIQYTIEKQTDNTLNYLDISIQNKGNGFTFGIYRKPTTTDMILHNSSCHPHEHKNAAIRHLINRMNTYPISQNNKIQEAHTINTILANNNYPTLTHPHNKKKQKQTQQTTHQEKKKWTTFTYVGKETRAITKLFKNTHINIAYRTNNTIQRHLKEKQHTDIYNKSGIYQLNCKGCPRKYIGQTGRNFNTRYKEHIHAIRTNSTNSRYAQHILDTQHPYGPMTDIMKILHLNQKGREMNTWERYHIYTLSRDELQLNDTHTDTHNPIFKIVNNYTKNM